VWDLMDPSGGVFLLSSKILGLGQAPGTRWTSSAPYIAGTRNRGSQTYERPVSWHVAVRAAGPEAWAALALAFNRTVRRDQVGTWTVTLPDGQAYSLVCRGDGPPIAFDASAAAFGYDEYDVGLVAEAPYWSGAPVTATFSSGAQVDFFDPGSTTTLFHISPDNTFTSASLTNPGDVDAWPVWTITGPTTSVQLTVGGHTIGLERDLTGSDVVVIDTDPRAQSSVLNGVRTRGLIAPCDFAPIPPGASVPLGITVAGTGTVSVTIVPRYQELL